MSFENLQNLISPAIAIALLAGIESLLTAVVADGMIGTRHRSNMELIAQGLANVAAPDFWRHCSHRRYCAHGGKHQKRRQNAGGRTRAFIDALIHYACPWPVCEAHPSCISGRNPCHRSIRHEPVENVRSLLRSPRSDVFVLVTTFTLTVVFDLTVAIEVGLMLAVFLFIRRMAEVASVALLRASSMTRKQIQTIRRPLTAR